MTSWQAYQTLIWMGTHGHADFVLIVLGISCGMSLLIFGIFRFPEWWRYHSLERWIKRHGHR